MRDGLEKSMANELCRVANERFRYMLALRRVLQTAEISEPEIKVMLEKAKRTGSIK